MSIARTNQSYTINSMLYLNEVILVMFFLDFHVLEGVVLVALC